MVIKHLRYIKWAGWTSSPDRGMAPAILVRRHWRFFETLANDPMLTRRVLVVDNPMLSD